MVVVGAGVIGIEYASMFAALGTKVTVVERRDRMLEFCDSEIVEALKFHLRDLSVSFRFGETVAEVEADDSGTVTTLESGKRIPADTVMYSAGRQGADRRRSTSRPPGSTADDRGRIKVGRDFRTEVDAHLRRRRRDRLPGARGHLDGAGPARGATTPSASRPTRCIALQPIGIYTIPEISYCRADRGRAHRGRRSPTRSASRATASSPAARSSATPTACSSCWSPPTTRHAARRPRLRHRRHRARPHRPGGDDAAAAPSTTSSTPSSTTRRSSEAYKVAALDAVNKMRAVSRFGG